MNQPLQVARSAAGIALAVALAFFAVRAFLHDLWPHNQANSRIAAVVVAGTAAAIFAFPRGSVGRAVLAFSSVTAVSFCIIYDSLDALFDPIIDPDWPITVLAILMGLWLIPVFAI